jgi:hypothetical protein
MYLISFLDIGMASFINSDRFPELSKIIDVGGEKYTMEPGKNAIELEYKNYKDYRSAFGNDERTEYILRKYMYPALTNKKRLAFESPEEKQELIAILKKRTDKLQRSTEFSSSILKNTIIQRAYQNIQRLVQELENGTPGSGFSINLPELSLPCTKAKQYIKQISEERVFQLILEIAWYLLHPDMVPSKVKCDWAAAIKGLDTMRAGDLFTQIRGYEGEVGKSATQKPLNFFKKINLDGVAKAPSMQNALKKVLAAAEQFEGENAHEGMKEKVKTLLKLLQARKYINGELRNIDENRLDVIDVPKIEKALIKNPMAQVGGRAKALDGPLRDAMLPLFNYFKVVFDPIYGLVDTWVAGEGKNTLKQIILPQLTTILHICNNIEPAEVSTNGKNTYGIYKITNIDKDVVDFFTRVLRETETYVSGLADDRQKGTFMKQVFHLPKVRLSSLVPRSEPEYKDPATIPYIQFFTVGGNMQITQTQVGDGSPAGANAVNEFFTPNELYITCTSSKNGTQLEIPMNLYEIDYSKVNTEERALTIITPDNYFNKNKQDPPLLLEKMVTLSDRVIFNDAELALSIFVAFKQLMPNQNESAPASRSA